MRVCKFGGAALRDGDAFQQVHCIIKSQPERRVIVVSAPGAVEGREEKITDLLYACQSAAEAGCGFSHLFDRVAARYRQIAAALGLPAPDDDLRAVYTGLRQGATSDWAASRGEWLCARLLGRYLDWPAAEAAELIRFDGDGRLQAEETLARLRRLQTPCVLPGFYGADAAGAIHTFPRGGSDVTAALAAAACNADVYENWKDVRGIYAADPRWVPDAACVQAMTYRELRALARMGAQVMAEDAVSPLRRAGIALNVRSFREPEHPGTWVRPAFGQEARPAALAVTGKRGLSLWRLEKVEHGEELARRAIQAGLPLERLAVDADAVSLTLRRQEPLPETLRGLADQAFRHPHTAALSVVGEALNRADGAARFASALTAAGIRPLSLHMPPEGLSITAVIEEDAFGDGVRAAYDAFVRR